MPDLLSDFLLEGACLTARRREHGFSDLVFEKFQSDYLSNILRNLGELDWRITQRNQDQGARLLEGIWAEIEAHFRGRKRRRSQFRFFKSLKEAALVSASSRAATCPFGRSETEAAPVVNCGPTGNSTQEHVLREIPPLLEPSPSIFATPQKRQPEFFGVWRSVIVGLHEHQYPRPRSSCLGGDGGIRPVEAAAIQRLDG